MVISEGDLRRAITLLQSVSRLKGEEMITKQDILEVGGVSRFSMKFDWLIWFCCQIIFLF